MPRYTYQCVKCEKVFDATHPIGQKPIDCSELLENCTEKSALQKLLTPINVLKKQPKEKVGDVVKRHIENSRRD